MTPQHPAGRAPGAGMGLPTPGDLGVHPTERRPLKSKHLKRPGEQQTRETKFSQAPALPAPHSLPPPLLGVRTLTLLTRGWGNTPPRSPRPPHRPAALWSHAQGGVAPAVCPQLQGHHCLRSQTPRLSSPHGPPAPKFYPALATGMDVPFAGDSPKVGYPGPSTAPGRGQARGAHDGSTHTFLDTP